MNEDLAAELKAMASEDQRIRQRPPRTRKKFRVLMSLEETMEWRRVDVANTDRVREIVERYGWHGRSLVGDEGAEHAWLLAQRVAALERAVLKIHASASDATRRPTRDLDSAARSGMLKGDLSDRGRPGSQLSETGGTQHPLTCHGR